MFGQAEIAAPVAKATASTADRAGHCRTRRRLEPECRQIGCVGQQTWTSLAHQIFPVSGLATRRLSANRLERGLGRRPRNVADAFLCLTIWRTPRVRTRSTTLVRPCPQWSFSNRWTTTRAETGGQQRPIHEHRKSRLVARLARTAEPLARVRAVSVSVRPCPRWRQLHCGTGR